MSERCLDFDNCLLTKTFPYFNRFPPVHKLFYPNPHILHLFGQLIEVLKEQNNFEIEGNARSHKSRASVSLHFF